MEDQQQRKNNDLAGLDNLAKLLDNQFRIPGTNFTFGLDGLIGLVPYFGDMAGLLVSGYLLRTMAKKGAGPILMLRMMGNFALDAIVGVIPFLGDLFDFGFKANRRNVEMLKAYYATDKPRPKATTSLAILGFVFFLLFCVLIWLVWKGAAYLFSLAAG